MRLEVVLPTRVLVDTAVTKVVAEAENGSFGLLPRHLDLATALVPGVLVYVPAGDDARERYLGIDEGLLVKCGDLVRVATPSAVAGDDLLELRALVRDRYVDRDAREQAARGALTRLEAGVVRRFIELEEHR